MCQLDIDLLMINLVKLYSYDSMVTLFGFRVATYEKYRHRMSNKIVTCVSFLNVCITFTPTVEGVKMLHHATEIVEIVYHLTLPSDNLSKSQTDTVHHTPFGTKKCFFNLFERHL